MVAVVAAGTATLILRPRGGLIEPTAVEAKAYFSPGELERADDFRELQRLLGLGGIALSAATLGVIALRPPRRVRRLLGRASGRPLRGAALVGAGISLTIVVVGLPLAAWRHERAVDAGLATQSFGHWLGDVMKSAAISAVIAAIGAALALALIRRFPRHWWLPGSAVVAGFAVVGLYLSPVLLDPLFNDFEPLPRGQLRADVLRLADRAGVDVGEVYRVDASRRTSAANAYVNGLGNSKRVVLYDTLIDEFPHDEVRVVVGHELAHQKHNDLLRGLAWLALVAPAGTFLTQVLAERFAGRRELGRPAALPAVALAITLAALGLGAASNVLSREVEARADAFALDLTRDPADFIKFERRIALRNISDTDPPRLLHLLFATHPTTLERLGIGVAWRAE